MEIIKGDLIKLALDGEFDIIVHGCNCFNTMGAGIAKQIAYNFPKAEEVDSATMSGSIQKLGCFTMASTDKLLIVNAYTQYETAKHGEDVFEYDAFSLILRKLRSQFTNSRYGFPLIGMGLAGGNKERIMKILEDFAKEVETAGGSVTIVEWDK
jgi:O-acetyl-ADP-ribose deacetylase (regulator of RNase III)